MEWRTQVLFEMEQPKNAASRQTLIEYKWQVRTLETRRRTPKGQLMGCSKFLATGRASECIYLYINKKNSRR